jgi:tRNA nucleotidyltransferase (CCA-adding enzyme)
MAAVRNVAERDLLESVWALPHGVLLLTRLPADFVPAVHLVGGAVRDLLLGWSPSDLDLVVEGPAGAAAAALGGRERRHDRFGTITVTVDGASYDIASARRERYARPGALPDVEPGNLAEDLLRRDFTVNAIAVALSGPRRGAVNAAPGAIVDLDSRVLRVLHDASFTDDPTRLLRLARYQARLGFTIDARTLTLAQAAVSDGALSTVSGARLGNELRALAREANPVPALLALRSLGIDTAIAPGLGLGPREAELGAAAFELLPADGRGDLLALALACLGVERSRRLELLDDLAFEASDRDAIIAAASGSPAIAEALKTAAAPSEIGAAVAGAGVEAVALAGALGAAEPARRWLSSLRHISLVIDGGDLLEAGVAQGPAIGVGLRAALAAALDGRGEDREHQLAVALRAARGSG